MMGMTIEDCISKLIEILEEATDDENAVCYVTDIDEPTLKMAIDTMRKYQKIEDVVADFNNQYNHRTALDLMCEVKEVVEDGKID